MPKVAANPGWKWDTVIKAIKRFPLITRVFSPAMEKWSIVSLIFFSSPPQMKRTTSCNKTLRWMVSLWAMSEHRLPDFKHINWFPLSNESRLLKSYSLSHLKDDQISTFAANLFWPKQRLAFSTLTQYLHLVRPFWNSSKDWCVALFGSRIYNSKIYLWFSMLCYLFDQKVFLKKISSICKATDW